jgi:hypothetical protein
MSCIFEDYIKFIDSFLCNYYRILLDNKYERRLVRPFVEKYINIRYYNEYVVRESKFTDVLNKELNNIAKEMIEENGNREDTIKNIFALFSYILFFEKCDNFNGLNALLKSLFEDKIVTLTYSESQKDELNELVRGYISKKKEFFELFDFNDFMLFGNRYSKDVYVMDLIQNYTLSKLYSKYAIDTAYNSEVVNENKIYLELMMLSGRVLQDIINFNFKNDYVVDFPASLFDKPKKILKYLKMLDNEYLKTKISLKVKYADYKKYKKNINSLINDGYSISLELDDTYDMDFNHLLLFSYIFVNKKSKYYDIIINSKEDVKTEIITL